MREMRALCSHQFEAILLGDFEPEQVDIMVDEAAPANFNAIQLCVRAPGILYYPSELGPVHEYCREYDLLGEVVDKAHRAGLEVGKDWFRRARVSASCTPRPDSVWVVIARSTKLPNGRI